MRPDDPRPLLTAAQEIELARRVHGDDLGDAIRARDDLVMHNFGLAGVVVKKVMRRDPSRDYDDLFSEAVLGLLTAAALYDPAKHRARFSTYAITALFRRLRNYTDAETLVRVPYWVQNETIVGKQLERKRSKVRARLKDAATARRPVMSLSARGTLEGSGYAPVDPRPTPLEAIVSGEEFANMLDVFSQTDPIKAYCHVMNRVMSNSEIAFD